MMKNQYKQLHQFYCSEFKPDLIITAVSFFAVIIITFIAGYLKPELASNLVEFFAKQVEDLGLQEADVPASALIIFINNARATFIAIIYGLVPFVRLPVMLLGVNAAVIGLFGAYYLNNNFSMLEYLAGILPHGIFEIPAIIIALACGMYLCRCITENIRSKDKKKGVVGNTLKLTLRVFVFHVIPLLIAAAFVEAYITPIILSHFL